MTATDPAARTPRSSVDGGETRLRRISDAVCDALHITNHHKPASSNCQLAEALLKRVKEEMGDQFTEQEAAFCDPACLQRYLRARSMDVT